MHVYANIPDPIVILAPSDANLTKVPVNGFTPKAGFVLRKIKDQSNFLHSVSFCNISVRPGDHAPFLETHRNSVRLDRSVFMHIPYMGNIYATTLCKHIETTK